MHTDYLIIGQGISGTILSYNLLKEGKKVIVIDEPLPYTASKVASGLINPVTGKRVVKTWMIDELLPAALQTYQALEKELGIPIVQQYDILDFHTTGDAASVFAGRAEEEKDYLGIAVQEDEWQKYFRFNYGIGKIAPCLLIDINTLLKAWRQKLQSQNALLETKFDWKDCGMNPDKVTYKDITAEKIIYCEGSYGFNNPYFSLLPYSRNKGEIVIASIPDLPRTHIYKSGLKIVPWQNELFWIGSSFEWKYDNLLPTATYRKQAETALSHWLKLPYTILDQHAAERPATVEYKPFVGLHPAYPSVGIFNGMGTKGCSLAPYFARQFAMHLIGQGSLLPGVDIKRFARILSRN